MSSRVVTGIDLVEIKRLSTISKAIRERFIQRVYTEAEQLECAGLDERLAGKFAAKEAVSKALGSGIGKVHWRDIIILKYATGQPYVELAGTAALLAESLHLSNWSVSITHTGTLAAAFAVAIADE